ncbi:MAG TPA: hypothetical protein VFP59_17235 [Candidatus Angelobacter sp.]|nr:hypothetical protein [Candidatus Angelobacter sp.]
MATNPKLPPDVPRGRVIEPIPKRKAWWPPLLIVIAVAILIGLIVWLTHTPAKPAQSNSAQQVSGQQVELRDLRPGTPSAGGMELTGNLVNKSNHAITGATVQATFRNINGQALETVSSELSPAQGTGGVLGFAANPIQAGATRDFVIHFQHVPEGWNGNLPDLRIAQVSPGGK